MDSTNSAKVIKSKKIFKSNPSISHKDGKKVYHCPIDGCTVTFEKFQQLGGHKSKAHPGCSETYLKKIETRTRRKGERDLLLEAKTVWEEKHKGEGLFQSNYRSEL